VRTCAACGTPVRSYRYRLHPPDRSQFERCVGLAWCSGCRVYSEQLVHVPRSRALIDVLAALPRERREHIERSEARMVAFLDRAAAN
jgi:hypothetical protein